LATERGALRSMLIPGAGGAPVRLAGPDGRPRSQLVLAPRGSGTVALWTSTRAVVFASALSGTQVFAAPAEYSGCRSRRRL
ncbi:MAG TPA: hypothetical protein VN238_19740, partial [Solirubrobacteraceae bacterium]|nr:hypothetical protein [Solirubrobacteraceae bacterium]